MEQWFACDWKMAPISGPMLVLVLNKASGLGCRLGITDITRTDDGFFTATIYVGTPSMHSFDRFVDEAGRRLGLTEWTAFVPSVEDVRRTGEWTPDNGASLVEASQHFGRLNDNLRKTLSQD
jgi:hypothetical protein